MENFITRYRNVTFLVAILFAQVLGLAVQVKRSTDNKPTRLLRIWTVSAVTPFEKTIVWFQNSTGYLWHDYLYLRGVRQENRDLKAQIERLRLQEVRLKEDAEQARRLQLLLGFKEQYISQTKAAQVIGSCGSAQSRCVYIDKGSSDGIAPDMAVITADGVVGKVLRVFGSTSQVLLVDDQTSGVGAILEKSRLQGILRGTPAGEVVLEKVMADEQVQAGEKVFTSGGDLVFPKGMPVGAVMNVTKGSESFLNIRIKPAANLSKLEEVLVITKKEDKAPAVTDGAPVRAIDILTERLPSVPQKPPQDPNAPPPPTSGLVIAPAPGAASTAKPGDGNPSKLQAQGSGSVAKPAAVPSTSKPQGSTDAPPTKLSSSSPAAPKSSQGTGVAPQKPSSGAGAAPDTTKRIGDTTAKPMPVKPKPEVPPATQPPPDDRPH
jgi:rod shape-determining protein MreC